MIQRVAFTWVRHVLIGVEKKSFRPLQPDSFIKFRDILIGKLF